MEYFQRPYILLFIPLVILIMILHLKYKQNSGEFYILSDRYESIKNFTIGYFLQKTKWFTDIIFYCSIILLIIAVAGPGRTHKLIPNDTEGIDIMVALDISGSMSNGYDFLPENRLSVSKNLLKKFINKRTNDRIGLVLFAGAAYLQSPLTNDRITLANLVSEASDEDIAEQGTAIGDAVVLSAYRLKNSKAKSKIIILLTDGVSNTGKLDPETASFAAQTYDIKIYTIGIGKEDNQYEINYDTLQTISNQTKGIFFRAESPEILEDVLNEIDSLEKTDLPSKPQTVEETYFPIVLKYFYILLACYFILTIFPFGEKT
ncbi:VWA domain-containing protein [Leptospira sp. 96542]|nr:VWA domain-containing protein [Leptospira sp. 96542]